ncbi:rCG58922 [Rattus norvegicus]|uniref:RCG58922 n=1 Tax=Rattus norvegicus TaxID=10116 RepID=A6KQ32_RAT|nr:rCG58922 [Rattus norvegicus]
MDRPAPQLGKGAMHNAPLGCSRTLGWDRGTRLTPRKTQSRLTRERCSGHTEKRRGPCAPARKGLNRNCAAVGSAELLGGVVKGP